MDARLDILLVQKNLVSSREKAKEAIKAGQVFVNGKACVKSSQIFSQEADIKIQGETLKYVGRGGLKLEKALDFFKISVENKICGDIGASTGGFTDCMLQNGAKKVFSIDVGHNQLAEKLKNDDRVVNLEGVNIRYISKSEIPVALDFISVDVCFISLKLVLPKIREFLSQNGVIIALIKPQFEAGKSQIGKNGIVKSQKTHIDVLKSLFNFINENEFRIINISFSPIKGTDGNIEYLVQLENSHKNIDKFALNFDIKNFISEAFATLST